MATKTNVLFLCTGNTARSQMAEAFLRKYGSDRFEAHSAGLEPSEIDPLTRKVMEEAGLALDGQCSKSVQKYMGRKHFGYLITVCADAEKRCPSTFPGISQRLSWPFDDPAAFEGTEDGKLREFRRVRDEIEGRVRQWLEHMTD